MAFGITARGILDGIRERVIGKPVVDVVSNDPRIQQSDRARATLPQAQRGIQAARQASPLTRRAITSFGNSRVVRTLAKPGPGIQDALIRDPLTEAVRLGQGFRDIGREKKRGVAIPTQLHGLFNRESEAAGRIAPISELKRSTVTTDFLKRRGVPDFIAEGSGVLTGFGVTALFADPRFSAGSSGKKLPAVIKAISKTDNAADIVKQLKIINLTTKEAEAIAPVLKQVNNTDEIADIIKAGATGQAADVSQAAINAIRKDIDPDSVFTKRVLDELDGARAGDQHLIRGSGQGVTGVVGQKSHFPKWVPSELRSSKLFEKAIDAVHSGNTPTKGSKLGELVDLMNNRINKSLELTDDVIAKQVPQKPPRIRTSQPGGAQTQPLRQSLAKGSQAVPIKDGKVKATVSSTQPRGLVESVQEAPNITDPTKVKVKGDFTTKPNTQLMGEAQALLTEGGTISFRGVKNLDKKVAAAMQEALNLDAKGDHVAAAALYNNLAEHGTELGRSVQAFAMLEKMSPQAIALSAAGRIQKWNRTAGKSRQIPQLDGPQLKLISDSVEHIQTLPKGRNRNIAINEMEKLVNSFIPTNLSTKIMTVWKAGLLTSLRTHERNIVGNVIMGASEVAKDIPAAAADKTMALVTGKRSMAFTTRGLGEGVTKETGQQIADMVTKGFDPTDSINKFDYKKVNWGNGRVGKTLELYTESIFRSLGAGDKPFFNSAYGRSMYDQATTAALNTGKKGNKAFIENLVKNPTEDMLQIAFDEASRTTFKDKNILTNIASAVKRTASNPSFYNKLGAGDGKLGAEIGEIITETLMPFTGVPSSIVGKTLAYSPIGLMQGINHAGKVLIAPTSIPGLQRQASQEIGRGVMGTGLMAIGAYLTSKGLMTGQPKDAKEYAQWQTEGKGINSVMVGGKWRSINSVGPQTLVVLAGSKALSELQDEDGSLGTLAAGLAKDQLEQTFLSGVQRPLQAIQDPDRYGKSFIGNQASSVVPNIVKDVSKAFDPQAREFNTKSDYLKGAVPGLRNTLTPKRDVLGNLVKQEPSGMAAFFDLFNSKTPIKNTVVDEMSRLNDAGQSVTPGKVPKSQTVLGEKRRLEPDELDAQEKQIGERISPALTQLIESPDYARLGDEEKTKLIKDTISDIRKSTKLDIASGKTQVKGASESVGTLDVIRTIQDGREVQVDIGKVQRMPASSGFEKAKKADEAWKAAGKIFDTSIPDDEKTAIYDKLGINKDDIEYFSIASESTDLKGAAIGDVLAENPEGNIVDVLTPYRKDVNGEKILSNGVIDDLFRAGKVTSAEKKLLKSITGIDGEGQAIRSTGTGKAKKININIPKATRIKAVSTRSGASKRRRSGRRSSGATVKLPAAKQGARASATTIPKLAGARAKTIRKANVKALSPQLTRVTASKGR